MEDIKDKELDLSSHNMQAAYYVIRSILLQKYPPIDALNTLFGKRTKHTINAIEWFWKNDDLVLGENLRVKGRDPQEIFKARYAKEYDPIVDELDFYVHTQQKPPKDLMNIIFDEFADSVTSVYGYYDEANLIRDSGLPASTHPHNAAMTGYAMGFDFVGRASLAYHDVPEDLFVFLANKFNLEKGIKGYDIFMEKMIPYKLRMNVDAITNKYDLIISTIEDKLKNNIVEDSSGRSEIKGLTFNKKNSLEVLESLFNNDAGSLAKYVGRTYSIAYNLEDGDFFRERLKWACYRDYVKDIADICVSNNDFLAFDMKGIDLYYNGIGRDVVKRWNRNKNALKAMTWVNKGYEIHTNYAPLNNHIMEVAENTLRYSYDSVAKDFIKSIFVSSFTFRALTNLKQLTPVFFTDVDTDYTIKKPVVDAAQINI